MQEIEELLPLPKLSELVCRNAEFIAAQPFPHIVFDDFFDEPVVQRLIDKFPRPDSEGWLRYKRPAEFDKLQSNSELMIPPEIRSMIYALNSCSFIRFLEVLTGIKGLIPDPHLSGGGLHQTLREGRLKIHVDYNYHEQWRLDRRLNLILYLDDDWKDEWGGALELWDRQLTKCVKQISPIRNRVVVFSTTETSWHGHPDPLLCPADRTRKSIALYYYTNGRPDEEKGPAHTTIFKGRPGEDIGRSFTEVARDFIPPILLKLRRSLHRRA